MDLWDAFETGFNFANRIRTCYDARDVGRVLTCDDFPREIRELSNHIQWSRTREYGIQQAKKLIRIRLSMAEPPDSDKLESTQGSNSVGPAEPTQPAVIRGADAPRREASAEGPE